MTPSDRSFLKGVFSDEICRVSVMLNEDLSFWLGDTPRGQQ
jgi:hypothetical protein